MDEKPAFYISIDNVYVLMHTSKKIRYLLMVTEVFDQWLSSQTSKTRTMVLSRLDRLAVGHFGDHKRFDDLIELRWSGGMRIYAFSHDDKIVIALNGGNKNGQDKDIKAAKKIRKEVLAGLRPISKP